MDFNALLKLMVSKKASDLFITAGIPPSIKVNGRISPVSQSTLTPDQAREVVFSVMNDHQRTEFERDHECNFAISATGIGRFRVSAFVQRNFAGMVLRRIETRIPTTDELHLPPVVKNLAMVKRGLVILVGATGTGKSTSLASMIGYRNQNSTGHIITIEDPIEFVHQRKRCLISQREIGRHAKSFSSALRSALREDPDVILVGELRDLETIGLAVTAAETGILVLGTLHTSRADVTVDRIINTFPAGKQAQVRIMLSTSLRGVVAQQLARRADGEGRLAVSEILVNTPAVGSLIRDGKTEQLETVMQSGALVGMQTMDGELRRLMDAGMITGLEAYRRAISKDNFRRFAGSRADEVE
jgi:pilus retraction protein PilT